MQCIKNGGHYMQCNKKCSNVVKTANVHYTQCNKKCLLKKQMIYTGVSLT